MGVAGRAVSVIELSSVQLVRADRQQAGKPGRHGLVERCQVAVFEDGSEAEGGAQVVVIKDPDFGQLAEGHAKICQGAGEALAELHGRHVMSALGDAHGDSLFGDAGARDSHEAKNDPVAERGGLEEKSDLVTHGIGEDGFKDEALLLGDELTTKMIGEAGGGVGVQVELAGQDVGIDKTEGGGLKVGEVKRGLARTIRAGDGDDDGTLIETQVHTRAGLN